MSQWISEKATSYLVENGHAAWVATLDARVERTLSTHGLVAGKRLDGGAMSCVLTAWYDGGQQCVVKLCPDALRMAREVSYMRAVARQGGAEIFSNDDEVLIMAYLGDRPEQGQLGDSAVAGLLASRPWVEVSDWEGPEVCELDVEQRQEKILRRIKGWDESIFSQFVWAYREVEDLLSVKERVVCHGDLHSYNTFRTNSPPRNTVSNGSVNGSGFGLVVIDPLPVLGPKASDLGYWLADAQRGFAILERLRLMAECSAVDSSELFAWTLLGVGQHLSWTVAHDSSSASLFDLVALFAVLLKEL